MPDPKLQAAMEEVKVILKKHDIGAVIVLGSQTHTEYLLELSPTWSCITIEDDGLVRFRALRKDFASKEEQGKVITDSAGLLGGFMDNMELMLDGLKRLLLRLGKSVEIDHMSKHEPRKGQEEEGG